MSDTGRSGVPPWLIGLGGYLLYRRQRRRRAEAATDAVGAGGAGAAGGRRILQVSVSMFEPDPASDEVWRRVTVEGTAQHQEALERTVHELAQGRDRAPDRDRDRVDDVPAVLVPLGRRRSVDAVEVHATGGELGRLPDHAVRAVGDSLLATQLAHDQPCAVPARIHRGPDGMLVAEVLLPEVFEPGSGPG
jgi:hypothetical protein